jgi:ketosteroid isomerase-like protein
MKMTIFFKILLIGIILSSQTAIAQSSSNLLAGTPSDPNLKVMKAWYSAWEKKDWNSMRQILADGFTFSSPVDDHINIARFKERTWPNAESIKRFDVDKLVINGDNALVVTSGYTKSGKLFRNCDSFRFKDGKIIAYECFFGPGLHAPNNETR